MAVTSKGDGCREAALLPGNRVRWDWIKESLVDGVTSDRAVYEQKEPYSDEEVKKSTHSRRGRGNGVELTRTPADDRDWFAAPHRARVHARAW
jgi:hypothetical protein